MRKRTHQVTVILRLVTFSALLVVTPLAAHATVLVGMPGAPILPVIAPPNGTIFNLDPVVAATQTGSTITPFGTNPGADVPVVGGPCGSFVTGEICGTLEPGAGVGIRDWEVEIANENGALSETFIAGFRAPGIAQAYVLTLPLGSGVFFDFRYLGPTLPLFGVISFLPYNVDIDTSIIDPLSSTPLPDISFGGASFLENDSLINSSQLMDMDGVPEPASFALIGVGLIGAALVRLRTKQLRK